MTDKPNLINRDEKPENKAPGESKAKKPSKPHKSKEIAVVTPNLPPESPLALIQQAIQNNVPVETMEKLMDLQERWESRQSKKAFDKAMADFQSECPPIRKTSVVKNKDGSDRYKFAPLESVVEQVKGLLQKHGFSYTVDVRYENNIMLSTCKITHEAGHSENSTFPAPIDPAGFMNEAQKFASASTFAKRYAFCNAFGIMTADMDDDSVVAGAGIIDPIDASIEMIKGSKNIAALQDYKNKVMKYPSFTEQQKSRLVDIVDSRIEELKNPK